MNEPQLQSDDWWLLPSYAPETSSDYCGDLSTLPATKLCDACATVTSPSQCKESKPDATRRFPARWSTIERNALERACGICFALVHSMPPSVRSSMGEDTDIRFDWVLFAIMNRVSLHFEIGYTKDFQGESIAIDFDPIAAIKDTPRPRLRPVQTNNSLPSLEIARSWLRECTNHHGLCELESELESTPFIPTRLLYLGDVEHIIQPRLVLSHDLKTSIHYCTLSHCWGPDPSRILRLTKATLHEMQERINVTRLSRVFREAMEFAKRLGFSYIWIDSLCILQDDQADWRVEAAIMGDIYHHSDLTIAATKSSDGQGGCWSSRRVFDITPCIVDIPLEAYGNPGRVVRSVGLGALFWSCHITASPLLSRGWVTQELILSRRVVHCAEDQLFWDCGRLRANEAFPSGIPHAHQKSGLRSYHSARDPIAAKYDAWEMALRFFSTTALTYPRKDKLLVLASIARKLALDDHLIAGLWWNHMPHQLLWQTGCAKEEIGDHQPVYQAPSWSWASLNATVTNGQTKLHVKRVYASIRDVRITHEDDDPRAPIIAGYLDIDAPLLRISPPQAVGAARYSERIHIDSPCALDVSFTFDRSCQLTEVFLLWINESSNMRHYTNGIAVVPWSEPCTGEFRRVGHFLLYYGDDASDVAVDPRFVFEHADDEDFVHRGVNRDHPDGLPRYTVRIV